MSASRPQYIVGERGFGFGLKALKKFPELIPLVGILGFACTMATGYVGYSLYQKPDVRVVKSSELPPWERVNSEKHQKLYHVNIKPQKIDELEALKREIGSYKC